MFDKVEAKEKVVINEPILPDSFLVSVGGSCSLMVCSSADRRKLSCSDLYRHFNLLIDNCNVMANTRQVLGRKKIHMKLLLANVDHTPIVTLYGAR